LFDQLGYTTSAGVGQTKKFSKVIAGMNKPNQQTILPPRYMPELLNTIPLRSVHVRAVWSLLNVQSNQRSCV